MVKTIAQLYLDARRVLLTQEDDQMASMMARSLVCHITGKTHEQVIAQREMYVSEQDCALMDAAVARLMNGEPILQTALSCGYSTESHFIMTFKKYYGETPGTFLKMTTQ